MTQEDLERYMWRRNRPFRDFARRPNMFAGHAIPSVAGQHRANRFKFLITDTSQGRNHPAPLLTVREETGLYRYATEAEYMKDIDIKATRQRRREDANWEFELIRRRHVQAGLHYSLLFSPTCPVGTPRVNLNLESNVRASAPSPCVAFGCRDVVLCGCSFWFGRVAQSSGIKAKQDEASALPSTNAAPPVGDAAGKTVL